MFVVSPGIHTCKHVHTHTHTCMCARTHARTHTHAHTHTHTHTRTHAHAHTHTHTHTLTHTHSSHLVDLVSGEDGALSHVLQEGGHHIQAPLTRILQHKRDCLQQRVGKSTLIDRKSVHQMSITLCGTYVPIKPKAILAADHALRYSGCRKLRFACTRTCTNVAVNHTYMYVATFTVAHAMYAEHVHRIPQLNFSNRCKVKQGRFSHYIRVR